MYKIWEELATCSMLESNTPEGWVIVDTRDLLDGAGNDVDKVAEKIMLVGNLLCSGQKVVVRCRAGMSRSNTIACAAMMWIYMDCNWDTAWAKVVKECPRAMLNLEFFETVKQALIKLNGNFGAVKMKERLELNNPVPNPSGAIIDIRNQNYKEKKILVLDILRQAQIKPVTIEEIIEKAKGLVNINDVEKIIKENIDIITVCCNNTYCIHEYWFT